MNCVTNTNKQSTANQNQPTAVTVEVVYTSDYCNGAAPSPDIIEKLKIPAQLSNQRVYIFSKSNKEGDKIAVETNQEGKVNIKLAAGIYYFFLKEKVETTNIQLRTDRCENWLREADASFEVRKQGTQSVNLKIHKQCNPCFPPRR